MMKKEIVLTAAMMLFSMVASTTFVSQLKYTQRNITQKERLHLKQEMRV